MPNRVDSGPAISAVDVRRILELEQRSIRIPSPTFEEGEIADLYASTMADIRLDVEMMDVIHPQDPAKKSRQPIGRLRGTGDGPTLMLNGHMDPGAEMTGWTVDPFGAKFEDGWIWGIGAHDDKGGCVAAISAVEAIVHSGTRLRGDVIVTPVIAHKLGGAGTRALLNHGVKADLCINMEHSNNTIANVQEKLAIPTVQYGPGDIRIYKEWPTPDERVLLADLVTAAKAVAHATVCLCG
jgi:acetylornithine deacetylase